MLFLLVRKLWVLRILLVKTIPEGSSNAVEPIATGLVHNLHATTDYRGLVPLPLLTQLTPTNYDYHKLTGVGEEPPATVFFL